MKILIDINHPADVHQFKNMIWEMQKKGHEFKIVARDKECTFQLLDSYSIPYEKRKGYKGLLKKLIGMFFIDYRLYKIAKKFKPDVLIGSSGDCYIAQVGFLIGKQSIIFDDTEHSTFQNWLTFPFATKIITPSSYTLDLGRKQVRYLGTKEMAYLHPKYFKADPSVLSKLGVKKGEKYALIRFVSWEASHDVGKTGIVNKDELIKEVSKKYKIFISSEGEMPAHLQKFRINLHPFEMHSALSYSSLVVGEGATMIAEAAVLGIPAVYLNELPLGYMKWLKEKGMIYGSLKDAYRAKVKKNEIYDVTKEMINVVETCISQ